MDDNTNTLQLECLHDDNGRAYYCKGHIAIEDFMAALRNKVMADDAILAEFAFHTWMRKCRDFTGEHNQLLIEANAGSRGAFKVTWIQQEW